MEDVGRRRRRRIVLALAILWAASIAVLSSIPGDAFPAPVGLDFLDKVVHVTEFGVLGYLLARSFGSFVPAWLLATAWGVLDELHQRYTPNRFASVYDGLADAIGAAAGAVLALWLLSRRPADGDPS